MSTEAKVGLFVVIAAVLCIGTVYYLGNEQWGHHATPYRTYLHYAGGVEPGTTVLFGGITAGRVTAVRAWNEDPTKIELLLEVRFVRRNRGLIPAPVICQVSDRAQVRGSGRCGNRRIFSW